MSFPGVTVKWRIWALALVNGVLLGMVGLRLWNGTETDKILQVSAQRLKVPALSLNLPAPYCDFTGLRDRTPFYASRRLYVVPPKSAAPPPPVPNYLFGGAVIRPHGPAVALLNQPTYGGTLRVTAGQELEGWHVESVEVSRVVLRYEDQRAEIKRATKEANATAAGGGVSRVHVTLGSGAQGGGGVRVLGGAAQEVSRGTPAAVNLPPLAGSGSQSVYIPPPPR